MYDFIFKKHLIFNTNLFFRDIFFMNISSYKSALRRHLFKRGFVYSFIMPSGYLLSLFHAVNSLH